MQLFSRYVKLHEFTGLTKLIPGADVLVPIMGTLCLKGMARASFFENACFSLQGVYPITEEIGDAWMISHAGLLKKFPLTAHKSARVVIKDAFDLFKFKAIQIQVPDGPDVKWSQSIGFKETRRDGTKVTLHIIN